MLGSLDPNAAWFEMALVSVFFAFFDWRIPEGHLEERVGCESLHRCTCACISAYVLMVMGQSVETQVNNQWRKQAFTDFLEKFWHFPRWEESCSCTAERLIFISSPVLLSRPNLSRIEGGVNQAPMAATSTTNSTQLCPKSKMTAQPCSQIWRQSFPWIEFSAAFRLKKIKNHSPPPRLVSLEQRVLWIYCMFRLEISVATPPHGSKVEGTVNCLDGKLYLHVKHCVIQSLAPIAHLWNHRWSVFQSFLLHKMWASRAPPSNTPPLWEEVGLGLVKLYKSTKTTRLKTYSVLWAETIITTWV